MKNQVLIGWAGETTKHALVNKIPAPFSMAMTNHVPFGVAVERYFFQVPKVRALPITNRNN